LDILLKDYFPCLGSLNLLWSIYFYYSCPLKYGNNKNKLDIRVKQEKSVSSPQKQEKKRGKCQNKIYIKLEPTDSQLSANPETSNHYATKKRLFSKVRSTSNRRGIPIPIIALSILNNILEMCN
jgi:hypothetical protein